jgi:hypothetical protein
MAFFANNLGSPGAGEEIVFVSTAFHSPPVDVILASSDLVLFFVHSSTVLGECRSAFRACFGSPLENLKVNVL